MSDAVGHERRRESRMTIRTYRADADGPVSDSENQLLVARPRDPFSLPSTPLVWPACLCPKCQEGGAS